ncbi:hypothetical protein ACWGOQ_0012610 [Aquimarina sp. M1]
MRNINLIVILFFVIQGCSAQKNVIGKGYVYNHDKVSSLYDNTIFFKSDSTLIIYGGQLAYKYSSYPNYKKVNDSIYVIYYPNSTRRKPTKEELKDTIKTKVYMADVFNDTIYWKNDKELIFRERLFKLYEYKGVSLEDQ